MWKCVSATDLYGAMQAAVDNVYIQRTAMDPTSPRADLTREAFVGCQFTLTDVRRNVPNRRRIDRRWAEANVLHFFAATEEAGPLRKLNRFADKFLDADDRLVGAYGAVAVPQLDACVCTLIKHPDSRRAVVSMYPTHPHSVNLPHCWTCLHFLRQEGRLHMLVYQRSLNLPGVMPYDCVLLTNVLLYVAHWTQMPAGSIVWTVGSLHMPVDASVYTPVEQQSLLLDPTLLRSRSDCWRALCDGRLEEAPGGAR